MSVAAEFEVGTVVRVNGGAIVLARSVRNHQFYHFDITDKTDGGVAFLAGLEPGKRFKAVFYREGEDGFSQ